MVHPVPVDEAHRFLEMIRRELGARDVRLELGLEPPSAAFASAPLGNGVFVVVHFDGTTTTDVGAAREKLIELVASFHDAAEEAAGALGIARIPQSVSMPISGPEMALTEALVILADLAKAEVALVIDDASPEIWGASDPLLTHVSTDDALTVARLDVRLRESSLALPELLAMDDAARRARLAEAEIPAAEVASLARQLVRTHDVIDELPLPRWLRIAHAIAGARHAHLGFGLVRAHVRAFAGIYRAVLVYEGPFSELHAEAALLRALPTIEKLVTSLPPRDPASGGAKVAVLRRLRRV